MRGVFIAFGLIWCGLADAGSTAGWRGDGSAVFATANPPESWSLDQAVWSVPTANWGNASPILVGGQLCYANEPVELVCVDAATGEQNWSAQNSYSDTLGREEAAAVEAKLAEIPRMEEEYRALQLEYSRLQREVRRGGSDATEALVAVTTAMSDKSAQLDGQLRFATPDNKEFIGYESPTPLFADNAIFASFGNGVVSRFSVDGVREWSVWLGEPHTPMHGYPFGTSASPVMADGVLVIGFGHLTGLDPKTGTLKWQTPRPFDDFGTPAVATVDGVAVVVTADGQVVRAGDGLVVGKDIAEICYIGPHARGDRVWFIGMCAERDTGGEVGAVAFELAWESPDQIAVTQRWRTGLKTRDRFYTTPVVHDGLVFVITRNGEMWALRDDDGSVAWNEDLEKRVFIQDIYEGPTVAGDKIFIGDETGAFGVIRASDTFELVSSFSVGPLRATPWFHGDRVYLRTLSHLTCLSR